MLFLFYNFAIFQSTPPARGATTTHCVVCQEGKISIHAPREGGDLLERTDDTPTITISIHAPREGGDIPKNSGKTIEFNFNPRPPRGGRLRDGLHRRCRRNISIHAPREGGDRQGGAAAPPHRVISIHAPREGGDDLVQELQNDEFVFQSTPPARGATAGQRVPPAQGQTISIHAPREGGRRCCASARRSTTRFQSTPPARGATWTKGDQYQSLAFQSTPPARGATFLMVYFRLLMKFQSTPPARGATDATVKTRHKAVISIHAPREGGRLADSVPWRGWYHFNPRPPRGGRQVKSNSRLFTREFQSTPPARGATVDLIPNDLTLDVISIHAPREGGDYAHSLILPSLSDFNPRPPRGGRRLM